MIDTETGKFSKHSIYGSGFYTKSNEYTWTHSAMFSRLLGALQTAHGQESTVTRIWTSPNDPTWRWECQINPPDLTGLPFLSEVEGHPDLDERVEISLPDGTMVTDAKPFEELMVALIPQKPTIAPKQQIKWGVDQKTHTIQPLSPRAERHLEKLSPRAHIEPMKPIREEMATRTASFELEGTQKPAAQEKKGWFFSMIFRILNFFGCCLI